MSSSITYQKIGYGSVGSASPKNICFSPHNNLATYLYPSNFGNLELYCIDLSSIKNEQKLKKKNNDDLKDLTSKLLFSIDRHVNVQSSVFNKYNELLKQRKRSFYHGIDSYSWSINYYTNEQFLLIYFNGNIYIYNSPEKNFITSPSMNSFSSYSSVQNNLYFPFHIEENGYLTNPIVSPNGKFVSFNLNNHLYLKNIEDSFQSNDNLLNLTEDFNLDNKKSVAVADYLAQEEMSR